MSLILINGFKILRMSSGTFVRVSNLLHCYIIPRIASKVELGTRTWTQILILFERFQSFKSGPQIFPPENSILKQIFLLFLPEKAKKLQQNFRKRNSQ